MKTDGYMEGMRRGMEDRRRAREELTATLGKPDLFVPHPDEDVAPGAGTGYWRVAGGVVSYTRLRGDGPWDPHSKVAYTEEFITNLHVLLEKEPRNV